MHVYIYIYLCIPLDLSRMRTNRSQFRLLKYYIKPNDTVKSKKNLIIFVEST